MSDIQYGHLITTDSYYDGEVTHTKKEIRVDQFSSRETLLKDYIAALSVISNKETTKLTVEICLDKQERIKLTKKWLV